MKLFLVFVGFFLNFGNLFSATAVLPMSIPLHREVAEQYVPVPWWHLCCGNRVNQEFMTDVGLVHTLVTSLKVTSPHALRQLFLKIGNPEYLFSREVRRQLRALGFLQPDGRVRPSWGFLVLVSLLENSHLEEFGGFSKKIAAEDLLHREPRALEFLARNLNDIPADFVATIQTSYPGLVHDNVRNALDLEDIDYIRAVATELGAYGLAPLATLLTPKALDDVFFDLGIIADIS